MSLLATVVLASTVTAAPNVKLYPNACVGLPYQEVNILGRNHRLYWTIDDHPSRYTKSILRILKRERIKATFFLVTSPLNAYYRNPKWPPLIKLANYIKTMLSEGHTLANHSVTHGLLCKNTDKRVRWEVGRTQYLVKRLTGVTLKHWRPPHGIRCGQTRRAAKRYKLRTVMWDDSDWKRSPKQMWWTILRRVKRHHLYTIVLIHYSSRKFERLLKYIKSAAPSKSTQPQKL